MMAETGRWIEMGCDGPRGDDHSGWASGRSSGDGQHGASNFLLLVGKVASETKACPGK